MIRNIGLAMPGHIWGISLWRQASLSCRPKEEQSWARPIVENGSIGERLYANARTLFKSRSMRTAIAPRGLNLMGFQIYKLRHGRKVPGTVEPVNGAWRAF